MISKAAAVIEAEDGVGVRDLFFPLRLASAQASRTWYPG